MQTSKEKDSLRIEALPNSYTRQPSEGESTDMFAQPPGYGNPNDVIGSQVKRPGQSKVLLTTVGKSFPTFLVDNNATSLRRYQMGTM